MNTIKNPNAPADCPNCQTADQLCFYHDLEVAPEQPSPEERAAQTAKIEAEIDAAEGDIRLYRD